MNFGKWIPFEMWSISWWLAHARFVSGGSPSIKIRTFTFSVLLRTCPLIGLANLILCEVGGELSNISWQMTAERLEQGDQCAKLGLPERDADGNI